MGSPVLYWTPKGVGRGENSSIAHPWDLWCLCILDLVSSGHWGAPGMGQRGLWAGWCRMDVTPWSRIRTTMLP